MAINHDRHYFFAKKMQKPNIYTSIISKKYEY